MIQELCILKGFSKDQAKRGLEVLYQNKSEDIKTTFAPLTEDMTQRVVEEVLEELFRGDASNGKALTQGTRFVFMAVYSKERAVAIMRAVKSVSNNPHDIIFAMITETALKWTFNQYMNHVGEEHEYMKSHNPEQDPDMKPV